MKKTIFVLMCWFALLVFICVSVSGSPGALKGRKVRASLPPELAVDIDFGTLPLYFIANKGQVKQEARFYANASGYTLWLTPGGMVFDAFRVAAPSSSSSVKGKPTLLCNESRLLFVGAAKNPRMKAVRGSGFPVKSRNGSAKSRFLARSTTGAVMYENLYKNIDLKVYGIERQIEYDWIVRSNGDPAHICMEYADVGGTGIDKAGNLLVETGFGQLTHKKPVAFQEVVRGGVTEREYVVVRFKRIGSNGYGFEVGRYDRARPLIIAPVVLAHTAFR